MTDLVDSGIDLAIRMGHLEDSNLIARKIAVSHSVVCVSPEYLRRYGTPTHPDDLEAHNCLSFRTERGKKHWSFELPQGSRNVSISGRLNVNSLVLLRSAALAGLGIVMIPTWIIGDELKHGDLVPLLQQFPLLPSGTPIHAIFAHNRHLAPKVRAFVDFLVERMHKL